MADAVEERSTDDLEDEWHDRQARSAGNCRCHFEMPGSCPGPHNCPMCAADSDEGEHDGAAMRIMLGASL